MPIAQLRKLSPNDITMLFQQIDASLISAEAKRAFKAIVLAGNNPDSSKLETIIKTLPKERQAQIYQIFEEIAARQKQQDDDAAKALLLLGLLTLGSLLTAYLVSAEQEALQTAQLLEIMKRAYMQGIQDEINFCGCNARAKSPTGAELVYLTELAKTDAKSIIETYNKDASTYLAKLYEDNPNGTKGFFIENMKAWAAKRSIWKSLSIAFNTNTRAREYGRMRFMQENYAETAKYLFKGSYPVCEDCMRLWTMGAVDFAYTQRFPNPQHPNCDHFWRIQRKPKVNCADLWVG